jgi:hypothetical protein
VATLSDENGIITLSDATNSTGIQQGSGSYKISYGDTEYRPMKLSASRDFTLSFKAGVTINKVTLMAMSNGDAGGNVGGGNGDSSSLGTFPARNTNGNCLTVDITNNTGLRFSKQALAIIVVEYSTTSTVAVTTGYSVTLKDGTEDAANWTIEPNAGLNGGETVTITYNGTKRIQSITAVKKAATPAGQARTWNFTQWSEATANNIKADAAASKTEGWSDIEKEKDAKDGKSAGETEDKCFWYQGEVNSDGTLSANGSVIEELKGLKFNEEYASRRDLAIAVDYSSTSLGDYAGGAYLMLGGGKVQSPDKRICCFTIPNVKIGQKITVVVESHKPSTGRGISLFVNSVKDDDNKIGDSFMPTTKESYTWENWTLPDGITADGDTVDILVCNNDACHIYSITVE